MGYKIIYTKRAEKDAKKLESTNLDEKAKNLLRTMSENPYQNPPSYEKLVGDLNAFYSRRINIIHTLVYQVYEEEKIIKILSMWTHYE